MNQQGKIHYLRYHANVRFLNVKDISVLTHFRKNYMSLNVINSHTLRISAMSQIQAVSSQ